MTGTSSVPAVKTGLRGYLASLEGLRPSDDVRVHSAPVTPDDAGLHHVILGDVTTTLSQGGLATRVESVTLTAYITALAAGDDETARASARDDVYTLFAAVEAGISIDPSAGGVVPGPGRLVIASATLQEVPVDLDGSAARRVQLSFTLTWTSHLIG